MNLSAELRMLIAGRGALSGFSQVILSRQRANGLCNIKKIYGKDNLKKIFLD